MADAMPMWTIYERPEDYPENYVVREWHVRDGGAFPMGVQLAGSLEEARRLVPASSHRIPREPGDDHTIVESWV